MIIIEAKLVSAISRDRDRQLVRLEISNDGTGGKSIGNYDVRCVVPNNGRTGRIVGYPREKISVGHLIRQAFEAVGYTK
jgi:hypothetical protein